MLIQTNNNNLQFIRYRLHAEDLVGGAMASTVEQYEAANGHSSSFWGWGGEDNDMYYRLNLNFENPEGKWPDNIHE